MALNFQPSVILPRSALHFGVMIFCFAVPACAPGPRPENTVGRFFRSMNDKDVNSLLRCIDPRQERMYRASFRMIERFSRGRIPVEDMLELVPGLYQLFQEQITEDFKFRDLRIGSARLSGGDATVPATVTVVTKTRGSGQAQSQNIIFTLRRFDEGWRIIGIKNQ